MVIARLVVDVCGAYVMTWLDDISVNVVDVFTKELTNQFPTWSCMDAMGIRYSQYWPQLNYWENFIFHLVYIKTYYVHECTLKSISYFLTCLIGLDIQVNMFKISIKVNSPHNAELPCGINLLMHLWRTFFVSSILKNHILD